MFWLLSHHVKCLPGPSSAPPETSSLFPPAVRALVNDPPLCTSFVWRLRPKMLLSSTVFFLVKIFSSPCSGAAASPRLCFCHVSRLLPGQRYFQAVWNLKAH